jgi:hypothetical protein
LSNPNWNEKLKILTARLDKIRNRIKIAVISNEMTLREDGFFYFQDRGLPTEIDTIKESIIILFNSILEEANLSTIRMLNND